MSFDIRLPNITGKTEAEQMVQVKSYLHQLVEQLNWALNTVNSAKEGSTQGSEETLPIVYRNGEPSTQKEAEDTFNSIKALIIKSADIVKAYETTIFSDFKGKYFANSDFGTYVEETSRSVVENSKMVTETFKSVQTITKDDGTGRLDKLEEDVQTTNAYIKRGHLYYDDDGSSVVGIEVGETTDKGYHRYAQFTSERLTFYDVNGNPVAYIGAGDDDKSESNRLYVTGRAVFLGEIQLGGYKTDTVDGLAFTWIG